MPGIYYNHIRPIEVKALVLNIVRAMKAAYINVSQQDLITDVFKIKNIMIASGGM